ncbi:MAG TPA: PQQ-binding-like beta-propeller repeat protein [Verrucomicrobiae bacterium]|jgi:hypothetical protein|nr:PQQ-binding-like beta-propeller repeat protein [Verrucomicrobiae bacterium]
MRGSRLIPVIVVAGFVINGFAFSANAAADVPEHHNHDTRDGLYIDPAFTYAAATNLTRDTNFSGVIGGAVFAQPLYIENGPGGRAMIIAVTESNNVYALDAASGKVIWQDHVGTPVPGSSLPCGDIDPLGITGTPAVNLVNRTLYLDAMTTPDGGTTKKHLIYALNVDNGTTNLGWPVDVNATVKWGTTNFTSTSQNQRSALAVLGGYVYVPYSGLAGDCSTYYGWLVGVQENNPINVQAWATGARGGGIWGVAGASSDDGVTPYVATGNTFGASKWSGGEGILRFQPGPVFSGLTNDYWAATNWQALDNADADIGGSGTLMMDLPGATPSQLVVALGKDSNIYLLNRTNLGGVARSVVKVPAGSGSAIIGAGATYRTAQASYVTFNSGGVYSYRIQPGNPPTIPSNWQAAISGRGSPFVTSTDGTNNAIVWVMGAEGDQRLHGFNGDTGGVIFNGGGARELMAGLRRFNTAIAARGRIYVAGDNKVYAFTVPVPPVVLTNSTDLPDGTFQFSFANTPGLSFSIYGTTNLATSATNWTRLGSATETSPGQYQFTDTTARPQHYYRVTSP